MSFGTIKEALPCVGKRNSLSICMIVKNEEANIGRALASFQEFADEIIVNDTGSTDKTIEIVKSFPKTTLIQSEWKSDFAYSRNISLEKATCSWILWMDADDYVPPEQIDAFNKLKATRLDRLISFTIVNTENGKPTGLKFMQARMFPNHPKMRFVGRIHESVVTAAYGLGLNIMNTQILIWHMGYETEEIRTKKARRNLEIQLNDPEQTKSIEGLVELGDSYSILGENEKAIDYYRKASDFPNVPAEKIDMKTNAMNKLARHLSKENRDSEAKEIYEKCLSRFPKSEEAIYGLALILNGEGKKKESMQLFRKLLTLKVELSIGGTSYWTIKRNSLKFLSMYEYEEGNFKLARNYAEEIQKESPDDQDAKLLFEQANAALLNKKDPRPILSICMIVKNEEKNIGDCLSSVRGLADEIIVADTGSSDKTVEIAQKFGARVEHTEWKKDFATARNFSISFAKSKWIMWIDADDRIPQKTVIGIRERLKQEIPNKAFLLEVVNSTDEGRTGTRFSQIRIFPNSPQIKFEGRIHEQIINSIRKLRLPEIPLPFEMYHTGYDDPAILKEKQFRNLELFKEEYPDLEKMDPNAMFHFAASHEIIEDYENALFWMKKALEKSKKEHYGEFEILIPHDISRILEQQGDLQGALEWLDLSLSKDPYFEPSINRKAHILQTLGNESEAAKFYGYLVSLVSKAGFLPSNINQTRLQALQSLAEHWKSLGDAQTAIDILKLLKGFMTGAPHNPLSLSEIYIMRDKGKEALDNLEFAKGMAAENAGNGTNAADASGVVKAIKDTPEFAFFYGQALALSGKVQEAVDVVKKAREKFPQHSDLFELAKAMGIA